MKFRKRATLWIIVIMSIILACSRYYTIKNNFLYSIQNSSIQNSNQHILEKYMLESHIITTIQEGTEVTYETIAEYLKSVNTYTEDDSKIVVLATNEYEKVYSNVSKIDDLDIGELLRNGLDNYAIRKINDKYYMIFSTSLTVNNKSNYYVTAYDISNICEEKNRQLIESSIRDIVILAVSTIIILFVNSHINRLNLLVKQRDDFVNAFTHELKTPMTVIMGYADMLRLKKCDEEVSQKALKYIYLESKRLEKLSLKLIQLMSLSKEKIELQNIEVKNFIDNFLEKEDFNLGDNRIETNIDKAYIKGDKELLEVVIRNLVENANKAEPKDNIIRVEGKHIGNKKYRISVTDTGKGIPKEHISRVTENFYMVDKSRNNSGSGIGLALVKKILELHNSDIYIDSKIDIGTMVYFDLKEVKNENK